MIVKEKEGCEYHYESIGIVTVEGTDYEVYESGEEYGFAWAHDNGPIPETVDSIQEVFSRVAGFIDYRTGKRIAETKADPDFPKVAKVIFKELEF